MLHAGVYFISYLVLTNIGVQQKIAHLNSIKNMWLLQSRNGCKRFFVGFFLHIYKKWYVCSKLQLELTNRNFMGIMWDSAWHVIIMENSNSYFKTILRGPTLTRSMDLLGRKVSLKFKGNFTSSSTVFNQVNRNFFHLLLNQFLLTFWLFVCVHA